MVPEGAAKTAASTFPVRIALLGQPRVVSADGTREFPLTRKTLNVLAYLMLNRARPATRDSIAFALFPDDDEDAARGHLRRNLSYLLSGLPPTTETTKFILTENDRIAWNSEAPATIDLDVFERAIAEGRDDEAVAEYAGDLLPTLYDDWTTRERERLRDVFHGALSRIVARDRSLRQFAHAALAAHRLLDDDPWREDVVRQLIAVRYEAGDRAGALAAFETFACRLHAEMKVEPMPETFALRDAVLRGAQLTSSNPQRSFSTKHTRDTLGLPFVGRDAAMNVALEAWHTAADGRATVLFLSGQAGIGKSRFSAELARVVEREGGSVARGETSAGGEHRPYEVFIDALRSVRALRGRPSRESQDVWHRVLDELLSEHAQATFVDDRSARVRLFESMRRGISDLARSRPAMIILEDLHWAGLATIDMLEFVAVRLATACVLLVVTFRNDELARAHPLRSLRRQLRARDNAAELTLDVLSSDDARTAARAVTDTAVGDETLAGAVSWAAGVPLLLHEALLDIAGGREIGIGGITELFGARLDKLSPSGRTALMYGAVVGARFDVPALAATTGWSDDELFDALGESIELGLIRATADVPGLVFAFTHHLVHGAALEQLPGSDRAAAHALVARALAALPRTSSARAADIASHFDAAGDHLNATRYYTEAAQFALDVYANDEARFMATAGLSLIGDRAGCDQDHHACELLAIRERASARIGDIEQRRLDATRLCELIGDDADRASDAFERAFEAYRDDQIVRGKMLHQLQILADKSTKCAAIFQRTRAANGLLNADFPTACEASLRAAELFAEVGDERAALMSRLQYTHAAGRLSEYAEARQEIALLRPICEASEDIELRMHFHRVASAPLNSAAPECELADARQSRDLALRIGDRYNEARASQNIAVCLGRMRDYEGALREHLRTRDAYRDVNDVAGTSDAIVNLATVRGFCGDHAGAEELLNELDCVVLGRPWTGLRVAVTRATLAMRAGQAAKAEEHLTRARDLAVHLGQDVYIAHIERLFGEMCSALGRNTDARRHFNGAIEGFEKLKQPRLMAEVLAISARLYASDGDAHSARTQAQESIDLATRYPVEYYAESAWHIAASYALLGDAEVAGTFAQRAAFAFVDEAMHMSADLAEAYSRLSWHRDVIDFLNGRSVPLTLAQRTPVQI